MRGMGSAAMDLYYRTVAAVSTVFRGQRGSAFLVGLLGVLRSLREKMGLSSFEKLVEGHLGRVFPNADQTRIREILKEYWKRHQSSMVALFNNRRISPRDLDRYLVIEGRQLLDSALEEGRGVMLLVPHFGDERSLHIFLGMAGYPVSVISSRYMDAPPYVRKCRLLMGRKWNRVGFPDQDPRWMFQALRRGEILHIAPTGYGGPRGTWVSSFGVPVLASSAPYRLQRSTGCRMLTALCRVLPGMRYEIILQEFHPEPDGSDFSQRLFHRFEEAAMKWPGQYEWKTLVIRHRESNTIARLGRIPRNEEELERAAVPSDSDPDIVLMKQD